jgi:hypothetical protein
MVNLLSDSEKENVNK